MTNAPGRESEKRKKRLLNVSVLRVFREKLLNVNSSKMLEKQKKRKKPLQK